MTRLALAAMLLSSCWLCGCDEPKPTGGLIAIPKPRPSDQPSAQPGVQPSTGGSTTRAQAKKPPNNEKTPTN